MESGIDPRELHFVYGPTNPEEEALYALLLEALHSGPGELINDIDAYFGRIEAEILDSLSAK